MRISVIIPAFNGEQYLRQAVTSVFNSSFKSIRIIIVNDGSVDNTEKEVNQLLKEYTDIHYINKKNGGVSSARNAGIEFVMNSAEKDEFICFLDCDDALNASAFEKNTLEKNADCDIIAFGTVKSDETMARFSSPVLYGDKSYCNGKDLIWTFNGPFASLLYSVDLLKRYNIRFNEQAKYSEDKYFRMQCVRLSEKITSINKVLYVYRNNQHSAMHKIKKIDLKEYFFPIIQGWYDCDSFINARLPESEPCFFAGNTLASIYILEYLQFSYKKGIKAGKKAEKNIEDNGFLKQLKKMERKNVSDKQYAGMQQFFNRKAVFIFNCRLMGILDGIVELMKKIPIIHKMKNMRDYPFKEIA